MRRYLAIAIAALLTASCAERFAEPIDYVDPLIATCGDPDNDYWHHIPDFVPHACSRCAPGALTPFGMVNLGPVTRHEDDACSGYSCHDTTIAGFAFMHTSGSGWWAEFGNLLTSATNGELQTCHGLPDGSIPGYRSPFSDVKASAGYYAATLDKYGIRAECTATPHCGVMRFTFSESGLSRIQSDLAFRITGSSDFQSVRVTGPRAIEGMMIYTPHTGGWGNGAAKVSYNLYFHAELDRDMTSWGFWKAPVPEDLERLDKVVNSHEYMQMLADAEVIRNADSASGTSIGFFTEFPTHEGEQVELKVGFSFVDEEGARKNFAAEADGKTFDDLHASARELWKSELGKIRIKGGSNAQKRIFYTGFYHALVDPRIFTDVDGRYTAADGSVKVSEGYTRRTLFAGWDVFRSHMPLHTIINPSMIDDLLASQVALAHESGKGYFNRWEMLNSYTGCMLGNPTNSVFADAFSKGITHKYNVSDALECAVKSSEVPAEHLSLYNDDLIIVSAVLENAYFDWCTAKVAASLGRSDIEAEMLRRSEAWKGYFNSDLGWFLPKDAFGNWREAVPGWKTRWFYGACESDLLQQGWFVPHDFGALTQMLGGRENTVELLDDFFAKTEFKYGPTPYYLHGNEPVHWVPFLYNHLDEPWKSQHWVREILDKCYTDDPEGLTGNDDEGQMSAWYMLSAAGLHQICPGDGRVEIVAPLFERVEFSLDPDYYHGKKFTVIAHGAKHGYRYVHKAKLNGKPLNRCWFDFDAIAGGGTLELWLCPEPDKNWGTQN